MGENICERQESIVETVLNLQTDRRFKNGPVREQKNVTLDKSEEVSAAGFKKPKYFM
jgi:hypothetical protein